MLYMLYMPQMGPVTTSHAAAIYQHTIYFGDTEAISISVLGDVVVVSEGQERKMPLERAQKKQVDPL